MFTPLEESYFFYENLRLLVFENIMSKGNLG